jgi:hypothetical protein
MLFLESGRQQRGFLSSDNDAVVLYADDNTRAWALDALSHPLGNAGCER